MKILTTSGLFVEGTAEAILLRLSELVDAGIAIHDEEGERSFLAEPERADRYKTRDLAEIVAMTPDEILHDLEDAGHLLIGG